MFNAPFFRNAVLVVVSLLTCAASTPASAFVSAKSGVDQGVCSLAAPCRTFTYALTTVSTNGEIIAIDSGDYDPVQINKAVTLQAAPGVYASITPTGNYVAAVHVTAGASSTVTLRGLTLNAWGDQSGKSGVRSESGALLYIENCIINGFTVGISNNQGELFVKDTQVRGSNNALIIHQAKAFIENCRIEKNAYGLIATSNSRVTVRNTLAAGNGNYGFLASSDSTSTELYLENCVSTNNFSGVRSDGNAVVRVTNSTITHNHSGLLALIYNGVTGRLLSRGNNTVEGNTYNLTFTGQFSAK